MKYSKAIFYSVFSYTLSYIIFNRNMGYFDLKYGMNTAIPFNILLTILYTSLAVLFINEELFPYLLCEELIITRIGKHKYKILIFLKAILIISFILIVNIIIDYIFMNELSHLLLLSIIEILFLLSCYKLYLNSEYRVIIIIFIIMLERFLLKVLI